MELVPIVVWWALFLALLAAGAPLAALVAPRLPDRGAAFALPLALLVLVVPTYWLGQVYYGPATVLLAVLALAGLSAALSGRVTVDRSALLDLAVVFTVAFAFLLVVRVYDPAVHAGGGEKFLDFGILQSLLRGDSLPPEDMWFAGEHVLYYYGGHLLAATLAHATGTPGRFAYNLALSGFFATQVATAYGLAASVAATRGWSRRVAGALGGFLFGFASNLFTAAGLVAGYLGADAVLAIANATGKDPFKVIVSFDTFGYWWSSRVIPRTINEFPLFSYLNGDLHAHMTSMGFLLLVAGLCFAYYVTPADETLRRRFLLFGLLPPAAGFLVVVNTWSFPTALGVVWLTLALAPAGPRTLLPSRAASLLAADGDGVRAAAARELRRPLVALVGAVGVGALGLAWAGPFVGNVLLGGAPSQGVGLVESANRSPLLPFLIVHGAFLAVFALYLAGFLGDDPRVRAASLALGVPLLAFLGQSLNLVAVFVVGPLLLAGWYLARRAEERERWTGGPGFETVLLVGGAGVVLLVEFAFLNDSAGGGRYNTVFKTSTQVWTMWSVAAGVALAGLLDRPWGLLPTSDRTRRAVRVGAMSLLVVTLSVYGGFALVEHADGAPDEPTLDATRFAATWHPAEDKAIEWLDANVDGQPNIASAPGTEIYQWVNAPSSLTGIPTVAGWIHESGYRGREPYFERVRDVNRLFNGSAATRAAMLRKYDVAYIYVGPEETDRYGFVEFADEPGITVAYENQKVTVYAVDRSALTG